MSMNIHAADFDPTRYQTGSTTRTEYNNNNYSNATSTEEHNYEYSSNNYQNYRME
eukprot:CAMPEP_0195537400 /NCGR_PEP_ID=MMETSP0794_2-20130614/47866_1 /TAXON_ID=515487 /ORGANISM="Stephanopyxis turris, Strain CCMP 815" /LENGTH=54 /DNA_ID=CAMNT_0040671099 /DNA_START=186 /DNA_END=347 /DNA_ORIENTATION=+